jgi:hypothetical protein
MGVKLGLILREEHILREFQDMVLRKIFGPKRDEVTEEWRELSNDELNKLYSLPKIIRVSKSRGISWAGHVARMRERKGAYRVLVGKPERRRQLGRPRHRWEDGTEMDVHEVGLGHGLY